jgi:hypothetical protein
MTRIMGKHRLRPSSQLMDTYHDIMPAAFSLAEVKLDHAKVFGTVPSARRPAKSEVLQN